MDMIIGGSFADQAGMESSVEDLAVKLAETGTPLILVHMDARPFTSIVLAEKANAILEEWFPGTTWGTALAEVLFGEYNPAGRLPVTASRCEG